MRRPSAAPTAVGLAGERGAKTVQMYSVFEIEIGGEHGAVKGGKTQLVEEMELDAGEVAVGEKWLGMRGDELRGRGRRAGNSIRSRRAGT